MELGKLNKLVWRGGLSIVAALMLSGAAFAQDAATDDNVTDPAIEVVVTDGDSSIFEQTPVMTDGTEMIDDGEGIAVGEPDPNGDGEVVDDGGYTGDGGYTDEGTEPDGVMYTTADGACIDCNVIVTGRPLNPTEVQRGVTEVQRNLTDDAPVIANRNRSNNRPSAAAVALTTSMAQCMMQHPRSTWICEWQNGAGQ